MDKRYYVWLNAFNVPLHRPIEYTDYEEVHQEMLTHRFGYCRGQIKVAIAVGTKEELLKQYGQGRTFERWRKQDETPKETV